MRRLTAAMIVRNEAAFIEDCLQSLAGTVDEIILVDTGSSDDTLEKASRFPVSIHHFAWCDDFAAARNYALDRATGDWILYIDADERFQVRDRARLRQTLDDDSKVAWNLRFHPRIDWTPYSELRLFRNDPRIRFRGAIHEQIRPGIDVVAAADHLAVGDCDLAIQHVGYEDDQTRKNARNIPMLRARLARDPDHLFSWWHLGQCLSLAGDDDGAMEAWASGAAAARRMPASSRKISDALCAVSLIRMMIQHALDTSKTLREAIVLYPDHLSLRWIEATSALERGDTQTARPLLERLAAIDPEAFFDPLVSYDKSIFRHFAKEALALCYFREERFADAARLYRQAAKHSPDRESCEIKARLAELKAAL
jgi:tetratricopeptide (TPR) repeat protein